MGNAFGAQKTKKKVLSISGGGTRIIYYYSVLETLLQTYGKKSATQVFDRIAGTSAGAILALFLNLEIELSALKEILFECCKSIFDSPWQKKYLRLIRKGYMYEKTALSTLLDKYLKDMHAKDVKFEFCVPAYGVDAENKTFLRYFTNKDDVLLRDVILATTAACFYFEPHELGNVIYMDGGLYQNSPCEAALRDLPDAIALSIEPLPYDVCFRTQLKTVSLVRQIENVSATVFRAQQQLAQYNLQNRDVLFIDINDKTLPAEIAELVAKVKCAGLDSIKFLDDYYTLGKLVAQFFIANSKAKLDALFL